MYVMCYALSLASSQTAFADSPFASASSEDSRLRHPLGIAALLHGWPRLPLLYIACKHSFLPHRRTMRRYQIAVLSFFGVMVLEICIVNLGCTVSETFASRPR